MQPPSHAWEPEGWTWLIPWLTQTLTHQLLLLRFSDLSAGGHTVQRSNHVSDTP